MTIFASHVLFNPKQFSIPDYDCDHRRDIQSYGTLGYHLYKHTFYDNAFLSFFPQGLTTHLHILVRTNLEDDIYSAISVNYCLYSVLL